MYLEPFIAMLGGSPNRMLDGLLDIQDIERFDDEKAAFGRYLPDERCSGPAKMGTVLHVACCHNQFQPVGQPNALLARFGYNTGNTPA